MTTAPLQTFVASDGTLQQPPGSGTAGVASVFGRVGAVVAAFGDYLASQVAFGAGSVADALNALALLNAAGNLGATPSINIASGNLITGTLNANCTLTLTGLPAGKPWWGQLNAKQDATGSRTLTIVGAITPNAAGLALSTAANALDLISLSWDGTTLAASVAASALG